MSTPIYNALVRLRQFDPLEGIYYDESWSMPYLLGFPTRIVVGATPEQIEEFGLRGMDRVPIIQAYNGCDLGNIYKIEGFNNE